MNARCSICNHPQRAEIEQAHAVGVPLGKVAKKFGPSRTTRSKHWRVHVADAAQKALDAANDREIQAGDAILDEVDRLKDDAKLCDAALVLHGDHYVP